MVVRSTPTSNIQAESVEPVKRRGRPEANPRASKAYKAA
jgi:hypothetical protein